MSEGEKVRNRTTQQQKRRKERRGRQGRSSKTRTTRKEQQAAGTARTKPGLSFYSISTMARRALVLGNGLAGSEVQALGLARRCLLRCQPNQSTNKKEDNHHDEEHEHDVTLVRIPPTQWVRLLPTPLHLLLSTLTRNPYFGYDVDEAKKVLEQVRPDLVVSCGRSTVMLSRAMRRTKRNQLTTVHVLRPYIATTNFDFVVVPRHDVTPAGSNVLRMTGSLHDKTSEVLQQARDTFNFSPSLNLPTPRVAMLLGASHARHAKYDTATLVAATKGLASRVVANGGSIIAIGSRRTPNETMRQIKNILQELECPHTMWSPGISEQGENPYVHALATSDVIVVTPDTITMTCEALSAECSEGAYVMMSNVTTGKFQLFFEQLQKSCNIDTKQNDKGMLAGVPGVKRLYSTNATDDLENIVSIVVDSILRK